MITLILLINCCERLRITGDARTGSPCFGGQVVAGEAARVGSDRPGEDAGRDGGLFRRCAPVIAAAEKGRGGRKSTEEDDDDDGDDERRGGGGEGWEIAGEIARPFGGFPALLRPGRAHHVEERFNGVAT